MSLRSAYKLARQSFIAWCELPIDGAALAKAVLRELFRKRKENS